MNKKSRPADKGWSYSLRVGPGADDSSPLKKQLITKCYTGPRNWRVVVNTVMNLRVSQKVRDLTS